MTAPPKPFAVKLISGFDFTRKEEIGIVLADSEEDAVSRVEKQYAEVTCGLLEHRQIVPFDIGTGPCHIDFVITDSNSPSRLIHYGAREINFRTQTGAEIRDMPEKWQVCIFASTNKEVRAKTGLLTREFRTTGCMDYCLHGNLQSGKVDKDFDAIML